jgi:membrane associated rhomboid family serine protease
VDRLLARFERGFGRFAIENLTAYIVGGMGIVFLFKMAQPDFLLLLNLDPQLIMRGQVWRLVTYLFIPTGTSVYWILFNLYWVWLVGTNLDSHWGSFKYNVYYLIGMLGTTAAAWVTGQAQGNFFLNQSLLFAFATLFPDYEILLFLILPIRVKWLGLASAAYVAYEFAFGDWGVRAAVIACMANYLLFFTPTILGIARGRRVQWRQESRRADLRAASSPPPAQARACAICGATEASGADIRVCSCEKCKAANAGAARALCLEHARNH